MINKNLLIADLVSDKTHFIEMGSVKLKLV